ncbi:ATP-binding cassette sub- B member 6, mitochondrial [Linnemannia hyalina]|uniref:ATP-binding cassette sub- B member 6, mitochondrial n=1 Tax=Linnemannia hyalina TaxID=64524 RepID=A0A9P8BXR7_9FUNG|nr:ATP-binding cassette sub- B member 6, mitochondrial [Linnemannia hyalina]
MALLSTSVHVDATLVELILAVVLFSLSAGVAHQSVMSYRASHAASLDHHVIRSFVSATMTSAVFLFESSSLQAETKPRSIQGPRWLAFIPSWIALLSSCVSMFPLFSQASTILFAGGDSSRPSSKAMVENLWKFFFGVTGDVLQKVLIGSLVLRFGLLCLMGMLSVVILSEILDPTLLHLPASLLKDHMASPSKMNVEFAAMDSSPDTKDNGDKDSAEKTGKHGFKSILRKVVFSLRMSYPSGKRWLEVLYFVKFGIMILERAIVFYAPMQTERIIRSFSQTGQATDGSPVLSKFDMASIVSYVVYDYLKRYSNVLTAITAVVTSPVDDYARNSMALRFFEHVHGLSMEYHLNAKSGETMPVLRSGEDSVIYITDTLLYQILPSTLDVILSLAYFWFAWGWKYGLVIVVNVAIYMVINKYVTRRRIDTWNDFSVNSSKASSRATDSLQNFETVKHFTNETFEVDRYRVGLAGYSKKSLRATIEDSLLMMPRGLIWSWNLFIGCALCATEIAQGKRDASSFMTFIDTFGWVFSSIEREFNCVEKLFNILEAEPTVKDIPNAPPLVSKNGDIEFEDVGFQYSPDKKGISNISFKVPQGSTVGIVGPTGSGKSTLLKLMFRLWDPTSGRILIDGQDISKVTQTSVRQQIGVVPQDTTLLDESILYNIGYARPSATRAEIEDAAKAAHIHDNIMTFENGYDTSVGERGAKLSGGERQRIGIARVVLKRPSIILLDEATSALDSATESDIQKALNAVTENRTTFVVAHRLSTVMHADLILCIKDGRIVERGTHEELIQRAVENGGKGEYYKMWRIQSGENVSSSSSSVGGDERDSVLAMTPNVLSKVDPDVPTTPKKSAEEAIKVEE